MGLAINYNELANTDDGSCKEIIYAFIINYNPLATQNDITKCINSFGQQRKRRSLAREEREESNLEKNIQDGIVSVTSIHSGGGSFNIDVGTSSLIGHIAPEPEDGAHI